MNLIPKLGPNGIGHIILIVLSFAVFAAVYSMPMLATCGFESANLFTLIFSPLLALCAALNKDGRALGFLRLLSKELLWACCHILIIFSLLFARSFLVQSCSIGAGIGVFFIILCPPFLLNITIGTIFACLIPKPTFRILSLFIAYATYALWLAYVWWHDSPFRLITHLSILISSDLAEGAQLSPAIVIFRLATLCLSFGLIALSLMLLNKNTRRLSYNSPKKPWFYLLMAGVFLTSALTLSLYSRRSMGKTKKELIHDYSLVASKNNISVKANPDFTTNKEADAILQEALLFQVLLAKRLGSVSEKPITIWLHNNPEEKALYTGAQNVHFAQPKHREIHISGTTIPHDVLGHELAHIYVGEYATTFFGLPGKWRIIPNMALTEGLAMLLTPELTIDNDLDILEQAGSLYQAGIRVDILQLFSMNPLDFLSSDFRAAYIFAGAFLQFYLDKFPRENRAQILQKIIQDGSLAQIFTTQDKLFEALAEFSLLLTKPVPNRGILWAQNNFKASGILTSDCQKQRKADKREFWRLIRNDEALAAMTFISTMPFEEQIRLSLGAIDFLRRKNLCKSALLIAKPVAFLLGSKQDARLEQLRMQQITCLSEQNQLVEAREILGLIDPSFLSLGDRRALEIQREIIGRLANNPDQNVEPLLRNTQSLLGTGLEIDQMSFAYALGRVSQEQPFVNYAKYLYARMLMRADKCDTALPIILSIEEKNSLPELMQHENLFMKAQCQKALKFYDQAELSYQYLQALPLRSAERIAVNDALERINFLRANK